MNFIREDGRFCSYIGSSRRYHDRIRDCVVSLVQLIDIIDKMRDFVVS